MDLVNLRTLDLSCNEIRVIEGIDSLRNLIDLKLNDNLIEHINNLVFSLCIILYRIP